MSEPNYRCIDPTEAKRLLEAEGAVIVDVRSVVEFESGHIPDAYNIPIGLGVPPALTPNADFARVVASRFPKDAKLVFV